MISNYNELTLSKFLELRQMDWTDRDEVEMEVETMSILADMSEDDILDMPIMEYRKLAAQANFLTEEPKPASRPPKEITINGRVYTVLKDVKEMTTGQFIDYQSYIKEPEKAEQNLPFIMSCFCIPKGQKYGDYDIESVIPDMSQIPITTVLTISGFFFRKSQTLLSAMLTYLEWKTKKMMRKEKNQEMKTKLKTATEGLHTLKNSVKNGDGFQALTA